jgi:hypothetical protein
MPSNRPAKRRVQGMGEGSHHPVGLRRVRRSRKPAMAAERDQVGARNIPERSVGAQGLLQSDRATAGVIAERVSICGAETRRPASTPALLYLAPRPGLEPGTHGLTVRPHFPASTRHGSHISLRKSHRKPPRKPSKHAARFRFAERISLGRIDQIALADVMLGHLHGGMT